MRIGEVASAVGLPTQTIRFYERSGLLPRPRRDSNGYRTYDAAILSQLQFIRSGQGAGLTLLEIAAILDLRSEGVKPCTHVRELLSTKLTEVRTRQDELATLERELEGLINRSQQLDPAHCTDAEICHIIVPTHDATNPELPNARVSKP
ncbi:MerR family mercuric resistance operon transcriptional regulator [Cryobacterium sp. CAN_C3]|uniref:heavy metal-responsive transcriptional regulator n=1 Tax=unclassified Cryobacterium TaxID=2649013 RepID=UPI0018CAAF3A|nr:heavy metal-responsive transcriptional regulator [Cryobacterium sp. CAN_C3]MEC5155850.1 MerR family mercuric resistance operon transcriptional regulator [Cryobacterium sp. CAN_C3]